LVHPLFAEFKAVRFGSFFGLENETRVEVFDIARAFSDLRKNTPLRAPQLWRVGMNSHSLAANKIAFVWDHIPSRKRLSDEKWGASGMPILAAEISRDCNNPVWDIPTESEKEIEIYDSRLGYRAVAKLRFQTRKRGKPCSAGNRYALETSRLFFGELSHRELGRFV
jgi:hypothetical protein